MITMIIIKIIIIKGYSIGFGQLSVDIVGKSLSLSLNRIGPKSTDQTIAFAIKTQIHIHTHTHRERESECV